MRRYIWCVIAGSLLVFAGCASTDTGVSGATDAPRPVESLTGPGARDGHEMVYLPSAGAVVLLNGTDDASPLWSWDGGVWTALGRPLPLGPRRLSGVAFDDEREQLVVYGGFDESGQLSDTWTFDGEVWTEGSGAHPDARDHVGMAYDAGIDRTVLFGGRDRRDGLRGETWLWRETGWELLTGGGPAARIHHAMAYDAAERRVLVFGGQSESGDPLGDLWALGDDSWTELRPRGATPSPRLASRMTYAPSLGGTVLFGGQTGDGSYPDDTWLFEGGRWTRLRIPSPPGRIGHALAYDPRRDVVVMYGGFAGVTPFTDTWELDGRRWRKVS